MYFRELIPGEELSVEYSFRPDPILSPREFIVALHLIYEDPEAGRMHSNLVFNSTVDIVEMQKLIDTEMLFLYLMLAAVVGGGGEFDIGSSFRESAYSCSCCCSHTPQHPFSCSYPYGLRG